VLAKAVQELNTKVENLGSLASGGSHLTNSEMISIKKIASNLGNWSIDEDGTLMAVRVITDEIIAKKLKAEYGEIDNLRVGKPDKPRGIIMFDKTTQEPYCVEIDQGAVRATPGLCDNVSAPAPLPSQIQESSEASSSPIVSPPPPASDVPSDESGVSVSPYVSSVPALEPATTTPQDEHL